MYMHVHLCDGAWADVAQRQGKVAMLQVPRALASRLWAASDKRMSSHPPRPDVLRELEAESHLPEIFWSSTPDRQIITGGPPWLIACSVKLVG